MSEPKKLKKDYEELLRISVDMAKAISNANWQGRLTGPTEHMKRSVALFEAETGIKMFEDWDVQ